jgi:demethylmenaquinone methyltransferase/2-methoxy-6-polyprenyl-1,4-benzoquinol methylase
VSIAFGLRNVDRWTAAIAEFYRVLRPGGRLIIVEFTTPERRLMRGVFQVYFQHVLPAAASLISRDRSGAYYYLPRSVGTFAGPDRICSAMRDAGFTDVGRRSLTFGICACYRGVRRG